MTRDSAILKPSPAPVTTNNRSASMDLHQSPDLDKRISELQERQSDIESQIAFLKSAVAKLIVTSAPGPLP